MEESPRVFFSNFTSGLVGLISVNSTTYTTISQVIGIAALVGAVAYAFSNPSLVDGLSSQRRRTDDQNILGINKKNS